MLEKNLIKMYLLFFCSTLMRSEDQIISCNSGNDCPLQKCCRNDQGQAIIMPPFGTWGIWGTVITDQEGTCSSELGEEGDTCDNSCKCKPGLTCYKPVSGACCPPMKCYNSDWVAQQQEYWNNCKPPTCFFPPRNPIYS